MLPNCSATTLTLDSYEKLPSSDMTNGHFVFSVPRICSLKAIIAAPFTFHKLALPELPETISLPFLGNYIAKNADSNVIYLLTSSEIELQIKELTELTDVRFAFICERDEYNNTQVLCVPLPNANHVIFKDAMSHISRLTLDFSLGHLPVSFAPDTIEIVAELIEHNSQQILAFRLVDSNNLQYLENALEITIPEFNSQIQVSNVVYRSNILERYLQRKNGLWLQLDSNFTDYVFPNPHVVFHDGTNTLIYAYDSQQNQTAYALTLDALENSFNVSAVTTTIQIPTHRLKFRFQLQQN